MPQSKCVLCEKRLKLHQRRPVNKHISKYLRKTFFLESTSNDFICGKCSRPAYLDNQHTDSTKEQSATEGLPSNVNVTLSPQAICLKINSATRSHAYCFICKKPGPKLIVVPAKVRTEVLLRNNILITAESRCCPAHLNHSLDYFNENVLTDMKTIDHAYFNRTAILELLDKVRQHVLNTSRSMSFDNISFYTDDDLRNLTGLNKEQFLELFELYVKPHVKNTPVRSAVTTLGIYLFKMKSGLSNKLLSTLFSISKSSIRRAIHCSRNVLLKYFVTKQLGFSQISRNDVINNHTRILAQNLLADNKDQAILVLDGTYIYIHKSGNFHFQRRSFSIHKGRPLVKMMVIVTTTGHFVSVLGPYFADHKNNDASILKHIINNNIEEIKEWMQPSDIFVVDRGFRDSVTFLKDFGIQTEIPAFMTKGQKQMDTENANTSRLVTKVRWVVEAANARIKAFKYFEHVLPTTQIPHIGENVKIICALSNKYLPPINSTKDEEEDQINAKRIKDRVLKSNSLQTYVEENNLKRRSKKWVKVDDITDINFPSLDDTMLRLLTLGTYQLKLSNSYAQEYIDKDSDLQLYVEMNGLLRVRLQSRHVSSRSYLLWIQFDSDHVIAWYCTCKAGARTVGTCSHVTSVLWYLGTSKYQSGVHGVTEWGQYMEDAAAPLQVDTSDSEASETEECIIEE